jgi:hypothetical protein
MRLLKVDPLGVVSPTTPAQPMLVEDENVRKNVNIESLKYLKLGYRFFKLCFIYIFCIYFWQY